MHVMEYFSYCATMFIFLICINLMVMATDTSVTDELPTLYEYYYGKGMIFIKDGLSDDQPFFTLNTKNITIYSGSFDYFRVPRAYWGDRLRKMRAAGLNCVEINIPWNLHNPQKEVYDFGSGGTEYEDFLHLDELFKTIKEEDLFAFVRPGPYINSNIDFGGMPSWIIRKTENFRRSTDAHFMDYAQKYFSVLMPVLAEWTPIKEGPIIGMQIEHEFGNEHFNDTAYLQSLLDWMISEKYGIDDMLFYTADQPDNLKYGALTGVLQTINVDGNPEEMLKKLTSLQPDKPAMVADSYTGDFDQWGQVHRQKQWNDYTDQLQAVVSYPASVNMYMFVGGSNYGFIGGSSLTTNNSSDLQPDSTSYDYDAPITEYGTTTPKYDNIKKIIAQYNPIKTRLPDLPDPIPLTAYEPLAPTEQLLLSDAITQVNISVPSKNIVSMEILNANNENGQSFGYIVYRKINLNLQDNAVLKISGYVKDTVLVLVNGELVSPSPTSVDDLNGFGFWRLFNSTLTLNSKKMNKVTLDLVVENCGRSDSGVNQFKGLTDDVYINENKVTEWKIVPLEFTKKFNNVLGGWKKVTEEKQSSALYKFTLDITGSPSDTFLDMSRWTKGIAIVNGFVLGRYFFIGPQQTLYLAAPFLKNGTNEIIIFEHYNGPQNLTFATEPIWTVPKSPSFASSLIMVSIWNTALVICIVLSNTM